MNEAKVIHFNFRKTVWLVKLPGDLIFLVKSRYADEALMFVVERYGCNDEVPTVDPVEPEEERYLRASGVQVHEAD